MNSKLIHLKKINIVFRFFFLKVWQSAFIYDILQVLNAK